MDFDPSIYYSRHFPLKSIGKKGQSLLSKRHVLIAGIGGLGTKSADLLAGLGVGKITLVDFDIVEMSNLPRQSLYTVDDLGKAKVDVAAQRLRKRNPSIEVISVAAKLDGLNAASLLQDVDVVVDGLDRYSSRRPIHFHCMKQKIPFVFAGAVGETANLSTFIFEEEDPCMICAFGDIDDNPELTCEFQGVHPSILDITASIQVSEVVRLLTEKEPILKKKIMTIDLLDLDFEKFEIKKNPKCPVCTKNVEEKGRIGERKRHEINLFGQSTAKITSICGRNTYIVESKLLKNLDFNHIRENFKVLTSSENAISFEFMRSQISALKSGILTIRGPSSIGLVERIVRKVAGLTQSSVS